MSNPISLDHDKGDDEKFLCLLSRYLDRLTTPEEEAVLADELRESESKRRCFIEYCRHVATLQELVSKRSPTNEPPLPPDSLAGDSEAARKNQQLTGEPTGPTTYGFLAGAANGFGTLFTDVYRLGSVLVIAGAMFVFGLLAASQGLFAGKAAPVVVTASPVLHKERPQSKTPLIVGRLVRGLDAVWGKSSGTMGVGDPLAVDRVVHLRKGTAEIAFDCGARVLLQGPAQFKLTSPMAGVLHYGRLATEVPKEAKGFVVQTPRASIVDYGTSFSLDVSRDGRMEEAFVHEGEIRVGIGDEEVDETQPVKTLLKGQGVRIGADAGGKTVMREISKSATALSRSELEAFRPRLPNQIAGLRLWLRADAGTFQDLEGRIPAKSGDPVARWGDQSGNDLNAQQRVSAYRPRLVVDGQGRFALRFDGVGHRLSEPTRVGSLSQVLDSSSGGREQFTMCVALATSKSPSPTPTSSDVQFLFGQYPGATMDRSRCFMVDPGGQLVYGEAPPKTNHLRSDKVIRPNQMCVAVLTRDGDSRSIHLDGRLLVSDRDAERYAGRHTDKWCIGGRPGCRQFFQGDMCEFVVFSRALSDEERDGVEDYLADKYVRQDKGARSVPR